MLVKDQILLWRGRNRYWADQLLEAEFGKLLEAAEEEVQQASWKELCFHRSKILNDKIKPHAERWQAKQLARLRYRLEESFPKDISGISFADGAAAQGWQDTALTGAALASTLSPIAAIPILAGSVTAGTSYVFFTTAAVISWPVVASASVVAGASFYASKKFRARSKARLQRRLLDAVEHDLSASVFGKGSAKAAGSFRDAVLDAVDALARNRMQEYENSW